MIDCSTVLKDDIRFHYDISTLFYRLLWGRHIHHGLWNGSESPAVAQRQLTEALAARAGVARGARVLDVGCGMGGSSMHLAKAFDSAVTGITLSPFQRRWATCEAWLRGIERRPEFICADAETIEFAPDSFDVVWNIECTEHLFDKPRFFRQAASWLRPGGSIAICAWLAGDRTDAGSVQSVRDVCDGFFCPSLGTTDDYCHWMTDAGLVVECCEDWTARVARTWEICESRVERSRVRWIAKAVGRGSATFLNRFRTILDAYRSGAMTYGCFVARKPVHN